LGYCDHPQGVFTNTKLGIWQGPRVGHGLPKVSPSPTISYPLRPAGGPLLKRLYILFTGGPPTGWPAAVFYPFGQRTPMHLTHRGIHFQGKPSASATPSTTSFSLKLGRTSKPKAGNCGTSFLNMGGRKSGKDSRRTSTFQVSLHSLPILHFLSVHWTGGKQQPTCQPRMGMVARRAATIYTF
jgi:hypothetical protein